jgi:hypothetical protein
VFSNEKQKNGFFRFQNRQWINEWREYARWNNISLNIEVVSNNTKNKAILSMLKSVQKASFRNQE